MSPRALLHALVPGLALGAAIAAGGCARDADDAGAPTTVAPAASGGACGASYPTEHSGWRLGDALPDFAWAGIDGRGAPTTVRARDYHEPCAARPRLLVVRVSGGAWCGTCRWHAAHGAALVRRRAGDRARLLDVIVTDRDGAPATADDLPAWRALVDAPDGIAMAVDPSFALRAVAPESGLVTPLYVMVDARSMRIESYLSNPGAEELEDAVDATLARLDGASPPARREPALVDGIFTGAEWDMLRDVTVPGAPPPDPSNAVADSPAAARLGKALFFDEGLSPSGAVSCATCHDPKKQLSDGLPVARGAGVGSRRTPRIALAAHARWQLWDGRADSLWAQALGPLENPDEMGGSRLFVVRAIAERHGAAFREAFPASPLPDVSDLPAHGKPGDPAWEVLPAPRRDAITRAFVDAGKAIAAYERTFRVAPNRFDAYLTGDRDALDAGEKLGLTTFVRVGCMQCHWGPRLTDDAFHVTRLPGGRGVADLGRALGAATYAASDLSRSGPYSDAREAPRVVRPGVAGAFKTPPLRGVVGSGAAPYGHGGGATQLSTITELYGRGGLAPGDPRTTGDLPPWLMRFDEAAQWALPPFLATLSAEPIVP